MGKDVTAVLEDTQNLSINENENILRGSRYVKLLTDKCICERSYKHIICINCGHLMFGRVKYKCPKHTMITFLIDITNCPKCRSFQFMLSEFDVKDDKKIYYL